MIRKVVFILFIFLFTINIHAQEKPAFEKVKFGNELYGYWISSASMDKENEESINFKHTIYHFKENDSLDLIVNGKISKSIPAEGYNINDTFYVAFYGQVINKEKNIRRDLPRLSWKNDTIAFQFDKKSNAIFYRFKNNPIPEKEYASWLVGRTFGKVGMIHCGEVSMTESFLFKFETDSTYTKTSINTTLRYKNNKNIVERKINNIRIFSYEIEKDILLMESEEALRAVMVSRPVKIRQLLGLAENRLIISTMKEVSEEWITSVMNEVKEE